MSQDNKKPAKTQAHKAEIQIDGATYCMVNSHSVIYNISAHASKSCGALVDRGANGGIAGSDIRVINKTGRTVDVQGIDNHRLNSIPIVTAGAVIKTQQGPVIGIFHQYAYTGKGKSIHSPAQMESFKIEVDDKSAKVTNGKQRISTPDGYTIPINIRSGLPYISMRPYTDAEWSTLPHVILTADTDWDPSIIDNEIDDDETWYDAQTDIPDGSTGALFDKYGEYRKSTVVTHTLLSDYQLDHHKIPIDAMIDLYPRNGDSVSQWYNANLHEVYDVVISTEQDNGTETFDPYTLNPRTSDAPKAYQVHKPSIQEGKIDYERLRRYFAWLPADVVKKTIQCTTQYARIPMSTLLQKHYKSPFPAANIHRRDEPIATDTVYSDTPAVDSGYTCAQFFCGTESLVCDVYGMKTDSQFINTLQDNIRTRGAPKSLISDRAQVEVSNAVKDILRHLMIRDWQSEPHQQHQNPAERRYQDIKRMANTLMDRSGSPALTWLLALMYACFVFNFTASASLNWITPMSVLTGSTPDISPLMRFQLGQDERGRLFHRHGALQRELHVLRGHWVARGEFQPRADLEGEDLAAA
jgi:hypothetical protein